MKLTVGNVNHWKNLQEGTLTIRRYGALRSSFSATLILEKTSYIPLVGQEILIQEGENTLWGGILIECETECHSPTLAIAKLRGQGYEHLLQRYCFPSMELTDMTPSQAVTDIFSRFVPSNDGIILGSVDSGSVQSNVYSFYPAKASSVFDFLAKENGFQWWVDENKTFYMQKSIPRTTAETCIDLTETATDRLGDLQTFTFRSSTAGYRNVLYAFNKTTNVTGLGRNVPELTKMMLRYGSGQYGASTASSVVYSTTDGQQLAERILSEAPGTDEIEFTTDSDQFSLGQILNVTAPICGLETAQAFCVTEIRAVYFIDRFRYTVIANQTSDGTIQTAAWETTLAGRTTTEAR